MRFRVGHANRLSPVDYLEEDRGYTTKCWVWQKSINNRGYGVAYFKGGRGYAHRVYYERARGPIPDGLVVDHLCRVRACCNPDHLEVVTMTENLQRGHHRANLTREQVLELRRMFATGRYTRSQLAKHFSVSYSTVWGAATGKTWKGARVGSRGDA